METRCSSLCLASAEKATPSFKALNSLTRGHIQRKRKSRKGSHSTLSLLRKELREGNIQSLFGGSSFVVSSTNAAPDPLLSSFILPMADELVNAQSQSSAEVTPAKRGSDENMVERNVQSSPPLSIKDQEERARRSEFVHDLLLSSIF
ncbi:hypothetical protein Dimus_012095 [Dionaea muscipula]